MKVRKSFRINYVLSPQIVDAMRPKFQQMNEAVEEIRNTVQEVFNSGHTFTRKDLQYDQYEICCTFSDLKEYPSFPNVSTTYLIFHSDIKVNIICLGIYCQEYNLCRIRFAMTKKSRKTW